MPRRNHRRKRKELRDYYKRKTEKSRDYRRKTEKLQDYRKIEKIKDYRRKREELRREAVRSIERAKELERLADREARGLKRHADRAEFREGKLLDKMKRIKGFGVEKKKEYFESLRKKTYEDIKLRKKRIEDMDIRGSKELEKLKKDALEIKIPALDETKSIRESIKELGEKHKNLLAIEKLIKDQKKWEREMHLEEGAVPSPKKVQRVVKKITEPTRQKGRPVEVTLEQRIEQPARWTESETNEFVRKIQKQLSMIHDKGGKVAEEASKLMHRIAQDKLRGNELRQEDLNKAEKLRLSVLPAYMRAVPVSDISEQRLKVLQKWNNVLIQASKRKAVRPDEYRELFNAILQARVENKPVDSKYITRFKELGSMEAPPSGRKRAPPGRAASPSEIAESLAPREKVRREIIEERREFASEVEQFNLEHDIDNLLEDNKFKEFTTKKITVKHEEVEESGFEFLKKVAISASTGGVSIDKLNEAKAIIERWNKEKGEK